MNPPNEYCCPISLTIMDDPVICDDEKTYDRASITRWLMTSNTSPLTRQPISRRFRPNTELKRRITEWRTLHEPPAPTAPFSPYYIGAPKQAPDPEDPLAVVHPPLTSAEIRMNMMLAVGASQPLLPRHRQPPRPTLMMYICLECALTPEQAAMGNFRRLLVCFLYTLILALTIFLCYML